MVHGASEATSRFAKPKGIATSTDPRGIGNDRKAWSKKTGRPSTAFFGRGRLMRIHSLKSQVDDDARIADPGAWAGLGPLALRIGFMIASLLAGRDVVAADSIEHEFFKQKISPLLKEHCYRCHSGESEKIQGGLRVDSRSGLVRGGDSGPAVIAGNAAKSPLIQALRHEGGMAMPPKSDKLPDSVIVDFVTWIDQGAQAPEDGSGATGDPLAEARRHWAFQPVSNVTSPQTANADWSRNPLDSFVLSKLEERDWRPTSPAERSHLIRRVTLDVTGLLPSPEDVDQFVADERPDAYERLVDDLLNSSSYGERWAQHWLDVVRFAETEGYEYDRHLPEAWRFRDYVIDSFNQDKPFDQFVVEQIAGDELSAKNLEFQTASIFHRLGAVRRNAGNPDIALSRNEVLTERTDILGAAFLGLTVNCARCHNHKLEPISQKDYYRLQAFVAATEENNVVLATPEEQKDREAMAARLKSEIQTLKSMMSTASAGEKVQLEEQIARLEQQMPAASGVIPTTRNDMEKRTPIHVLRRGVWENKGEPVGPRPLSVLLPADIPSLDAEIPNPRTHLAKWLVSPDNPLTARVIVNRIWQNHFGMGIVKTSNDFGLKGERPSHPELLDWLTRTFVEQGWRLKPIHRLILLSSTYQQASTLANGTAQQVADPQNRLLWQFSRRRLSAEELRDAMLCASGRINQKLAGPSVMVPVEAELTQLLYNPGQWIVTKDVTEHDRRTIYLIAKRNLRLPFLENFDAPGLQTSCALRESSTHAPQALELLNGKLSNDLAISFANRLVLESNDDRSDLIDRAFRIVLGRAPREAERLTSLEFLRDQPVSEFALALFNLNEFLYVP